MNSEKNPIGIEPRWIWNEFRYQNLSDVIKRYLDAGLPIDPLWVNEYNELHDWLDKKEEYK